MKARICEQYKMTTDNQILVNALAGAGFQDLAEGVRKDELFCHRCVNNGIFTCPAKRIPELRKSGVHYFGDDGDSGIYFWIFEKGTTDGMIRRYLAGIGIELEGTANRGTPMYDCTGDFLADKVHILRQGSRVLATQHWGLDV